MTRNKQLIGFLLGPACLLLVPLVAMRFTDEVAWTVSDFVIAWLLLAGAGVTYTLVSGLRQDGAYRAGVGVAVVTALALVWINLAVGVIGSEDNPANLLYAGVLAIGAVGAIVARFQPRGMSRALLATALAQFLVPIIAILIWKPELTLGVLKVVVLNAGFVVLFCVSAVLFRIAARQLAAAR